MRIRLGAAAVFVLACGLLVALPSHSGAQGRSCLGRAVTIQATPGRRTVGTPGPDVIRGTPGPDLIVGKGGNDRICSLGGDDVVRGGRGRDRIRLGGGDDTARGGRGADLLLGGRGADRLFGGTAADILRGNAGPDQLDGGAGPDSCDGGRGRDTATSCNEVVLLTPPTWAPSSTRLPCREGPPMDEITRVRINPNLGPLLDDAERLLADGKAEALAYTIMVHGGPLPARVAEHHWFGLTFRSAASISQPTDLDSLILLLRTAYHEGIHGLVAFDCVQTGLTTGVEFPSTLEGFPQSATYSDVIDRIDALEAASDDELTSGAAELARWVAESYLTGDVATQGWPSQMAEMVAYVLEAEWSAAMTEAFGLDRPGWTPPAGINHNSKMHQLYRYLHEARTRPRLWSQLRDHGLPDVVAQYWELLSSIWSAYADQDPTPGFAWDLLFGPDVESLIEYTNGAAGLHVPVRPLSAVLRGQGD